MASCGGRHSNIDGADVIVGETGRIMKHQWTQMEERYVPFMGEEGEVKGLE